MKATGIVRRMDELGRVVIQRDIREKFHIKECEPLEIFTEDDKIVLRKYDTSDGRDEAVETLQEWLKDEEANTSLTDVEKIMFGLMLKKIAGKG